MKNVEKERLLASLEYEIKAAAAYRDANPQNEAIRNYAEGKLNVLQWAIWHLQHGSWDCLG